MQGLKQHTSSGISMTDPTAALRAILGPKGWLSGDDAVPYQRDWLNRYGVVPLGVARPATTAEVAAVIAACREGGLAVVPQGGNTGLCGGAVAEQPNAIIVSLSRMTAIGEPDRESGSITVEAG